MGERKDILLTPLCLKKSRNNALIYILNSFLASCRRHISIKEDANLTFRWRNMRISELCESYCRVGDQRWYDGREAWTIFGSGRRCDAFLVVMAGGIGNWLH